MNRKPSTSSGSGSGSGSGASSESSSLLREKYREALQRLKQEQQSTIAALKRQVDYLRQQDQLRVEEIDALHRSLEESSAQLEKYQSASLVEHTQDELEAKGVQIRRLREDLESVKNSYFDLLQQAQFHREHGAKVLENQRNQFVSMEKKLQGEICTLSDRVKELEQSRTELRRKEGILRRRVNQAQAALEPLRESLMELKRKAAQSDKEKDAVANAKETVITDQQDTIRHLEAQVEMLKGIVNERASASYNEKYALSRESTLRDGFGSTSVKSDSVQQVLKLIRGIIPVAMYESEVTENVLRRIEQIVESREFDVAERQQRIEILTRENSRLKRKLSECESQQLKVGEQQVNMENETSELKKQLQSDRDAMDTLAASYETVLREKQQLIEDSQKLIRSKQQRLDSLMYFSSHTQSNGVHLPDSNPSRLEARENVANRSVSRNIASQLYSNGTGTSADDGAGARKKKSTETRSSPISRPSSRSNGKENRPFPSNDAAHHNNYSSHYSSHYSKRAETHSTQDVGRINARSNLNSNGLGSIGTGIEDEIETLRNRLRQPTRGVENRYVNGGTSAGAAFAPPSSSSPLQNLNSNGTATRSDSRGGKRNKGKALDFEKYTRWTP